MKKRIIAALTALVMVVTMIPASAFAATETPKTDVQKAEDLVIALVQGEDDTVNAKDPKKDGQVTVNYTNADLKALDAAYAAYNKLGKGEQADFDATTFTKLKLAKKAFVKYLEVAKNYSTEAKKFTEKSLTATNIVNIKAGDAYVALDVSAADIAGSTGITVKALDNIQDKPAVDVSLIKNVDIKNADKAYKQEDIAVTDEQNNIVKALYTAIDGDAVASELNTNFTAALAKIDAIKGADKVVSADGTIDGASNGLFAAINEVMTSKVAAYGKVSNYIYLAANYDAFLRLNAEKMTFEAANDEMDAATLTLKNTDKKLGPVVNYVDGKTPVVEENYTAAKAAYDAAKAVLDKYKDTTYDGKSKTDLKAALDKMRDDDEKTFNGTLEKYERAVEAKALITELDGKTIDFALYEKYNTLLGYSAEFNTFADLDQYFVAKDATKFENALEKKYKEIAKAVATFKTTVSKRAVADRYGNDIKAAIDKLPAAIKITDEKAINEVVDMLNAYIAEHNEFFATDKITGDFAIVKSALNFNGTAIDLIDTGVFSLKDNLNEFIDATSLDGKDIEVLALAVLKLDAEKSADRFTNYEAALKASEFNTKVDLALGVNSILKGKLEKALTDYDKVAAKLTAEEIAVYKEADKERFENIDSAREAVRVYTKANTKAVIDKIKEINELIDGIVTEAEKASNANLTLDYATNKTLIEKVDAIFAADVDLKVIYDQKKGNDLAAAKAGTDAAKLVKLETARTEYTNSQFKPSENQAAKNVEALIKALAIVDDKTTMAKVEETAVAYMAAEKAYDELTTNEKAFVRNHERLTAVKTPLIEQLVANIDKAMAENFSVFVGGEFSDAQIAKAIEIKATLDKYATILGTTKYDPTVDVNAKGAVDAMLPGFANRANFFKVYLAVANEAYAPLVKEIKAVYTVIDAAAKATKAPTNGKEALVIINGVKAYNALSADAKALLNDKLNKLNSLDADMNFIVKEDILKYEEAAKAFVLEFANVEAIADQKLVDGVARPEVVVKDLAGNTLVKGVDYDVRYVGNNKVNEKASVIIFAVGNKYAGEKEVNFKIVANKPVAPTGLRVVDTDQGILKIAVDAVEGANYKFFIRKVGNTAWRESKVRTSNTVVFTECVKNAKYEVKAVIVVDGVFSEEATMDGTVWTNRIGTKAGKMYTPKFASFKLTGRNAKAVAKNVAYDNEQYRLLWKKAGNTTWKAGSWSTNRTRPVYKLQKGAKYSFKLQYRYKSDVNGSYVNSGYSAIKTATVK